MKCKAKVIPGGIDIKLERTIIFNLKSESSQYLAEGCK